MNGYLLDTDICSHHLRGTEVVSRQLLNHATDLRISVVTLAELLTWTMRRNAVPRWHRSLLRFLETVDVLPVNGVVAEEAGRMRANLFDGGHPLPIGDVLIAATARTHDMRLVTHNVRHFSAIPGLQVEDWLSE